MPALLPLASAGAPAQSATLTVVISASSIKPITLSATQNLDLGTIVLGTGQWSGTVVGISQAGVVSCGSSNVVCVGSSQVAKYRITGSGRETITINAPDVILVNQADPSKTLTLVLDSPGTVVLGNSGNKGEEFALGGSIQVSSTTTGGLYIGTFNVTADY
ncbi:hypothetical protein GCM10022276_12120 [Sphingomonas limnosediminicola]|uniref:DUF4402 domain-containing protein n=1 Tax=Sphingomonas limnosediminicola TaxID=940133 RepID=A0ABP7L403_9SPHN